jgi:hypothetical protein
MEAGGNKAGYMANGREFKCDGHRAPLQHKGEMLARLSRS